MVQVGDPVLNNNAVPNKASLPIHDPRLSLSRLSVVWKSLPISTRTGNSGHGWEDLDVLSGNLVMTKAVKRILIGCGVILTLIGIAIVLVIVYSNPGKASAHRFDSFKMSPEACINAFNGQGGSAFTHIWILSSPDLKAWWGPNGIRADADLVLDSDDSEVIEAVLAHTGRSSGSPNHVRSLSKGRIYHVLLFDELRGVYAHLRFSYRSEQVDGSIVFKVVTDHNGANPVKDCLGFLEFEKQYLDIEMSH